MGDPFYPATFNFGGDVVDHIARTADKPALIWANAAGDERRFLFSDIARLSACLASSLQARGVKKGDRVIVMLPRIPEWQIAMVACLKLGAIAIPCVDMLTPKDIVHRIKRAEVNAVITTAVQTPKFADMLDHLPVRIAVGDADGWESAGGLIDEGDPQFAPVTVDAEDPVLLYFTSGSTGQPKGVLHAARGLYLWRHSATEWLDLKPEDIMWCTADTGWSKAGTSILFGPWSRGSGVFFYDGPFEPAERLRLIERHGVTVYCGSSTELFRVLSEDMTRYDLSRLRRTVSAGETLSSIVTRRWLEATGHVVFEAYGQTESLMSLGYTPATPYRQGSTGKPLAHNDVAVIDGTGRPLPPGQEGEIAVRAPNPQLMLGYWQDPERTAACYLDGPDGRWFVTGDRAEMDADGYFFHRGRGDDLINSAGYRIGPAEVEDALLLHPAVAEVAVVGAPDEARGEIVCAFVVLKAGYDPGDALVRELQESVKAITAPYKYPRAIRFVRELPKTLTGKLQRHVLRERARTPIQ
ncbi:MAG TPA: acyl-CoA synthetase [Sphingobium sp.]|nr:acyl-CoA synthetase [Sphingobium sp.]